MAPRHSFFELAGNVPSWLVWVKVALVISILALSYVWKELRVLRNYALVFEVLWLALKVAAWQAAQHDFEICQVTWLHFHHVIYSSNFLI